MSSLQRIIKYCAIAFAIFLAVSIISGIASVAFAIVHFVPGKSIHSEIWREESVDYSNTFEGVKSLEINHKIGELSIKTGDCFKVEGSNVPERFEAKVNNNGKLIINYHSSFFDFPWFHIKGADKANCRVTVYVPADFVAEKVKLETGAGNLSLEGLKTDELKISAGAGNINGTDLTAEKADIDGGVGNINLNNVKFSDTVLDCGVGNMDISGVLSGDTKLDNGVGDVELDLTGNVNDYNINVDSGIGSVRLNGEKISGDNKYSSDAANEIKVDGGIGNVRINIKAD